MERTVLDEMLMNLARAGGTTLHLVAGQPPSMRICGKLIRSDEDGVLADEALVELTREFLFADQIALLENGREVKVLYACESGDRFRATVLRHLHGIGLVFRRVPDTVPTLEDLEMPPLVDSFCAMRRGLVLMTGFYGSGKSTSLAALIDRINTERSAHIVSVEPQIEFVHVSKHSIVHQREVGTHVSTITEGIHQAFEQGAEVLAVGDVPDGHSLRAVLDAVERGMLVFASFEASGVVGAIDDLLQRVHRERRAGVRERLADSLRAVVSQALVPRRHGNGRVPLLEILVRNQAAARAIRKGRLDGLEEVMLHGRGLGMQTSDMALRDLLGRHLISAEEAAHHAVDRDWVCSRGPIGS